MTQPPTFSLHGIAVRCTNTGILEILPADTEPVSLALVCWHGDWRYVHQRGMSDVKLDQQEGAVTVAGEMVDGEGTIALGVQARYEASDTGLALTYRFRRPEAIQLRRGVLLGVHIPRPDYDGRRQLVAPATPVRIPARLSAAGREYWLDIGQGRALVISLPEPQAMELRAEGDSYIVRISLAPPQFDECTAELKLAVRDMPDHFPGEVKGDDRPLAIGSVTPDSATVPRYGLFEARIDLTASYENPFDPDEIAIDATFTSPSGRTLSVPCFYMLDYCRRVTGDVEELELVDDGSWRLRFTPEEVGTYEFSIVARDRSGEVRWKGGRLRAVASDLPGFVRVSPRSPRYLQLSTGQSLFPIGHNLPTYHVQKYLADRELAKMHSGGENYNRWWMYSRELGLEWEHAPGWYRQPSAWRMDFALCLAEKFGFWFMLCLDTHQDFRGSKPWEGWPNNPYNARMGGPCEKPADFFTNPHAKAYYRKRLRYLVARYGWSTRVLCWEFGNEFEGWPGTPPEDLLAWHREMSDYLRRLDPYRHLITTSFWTPSGRPRVWELPNIDIVQTHHYANRKVDMARMVAADCLEKYENYRKPHIYGEVGLHSRFRLEPTDPHGNYLHNCAWAALMSGAASTAMSWWHESYIDKNNLYGVFRGIAAFVRDLPLARYRWRPLKVRSAEWLEQPRVPPGDIEVPALYGWGKPRVTTFTVSPTGEVNDPSQVPSLLHGRAHRDIRTPLIFLVRYPAAGQFKVHVDTVSAGGLLKIFIDGHLVRQLELPCGEGLGKKSEWMERWKLWQTTYDEDFAVPVPPGQHEIRLENDGRDWIRVSRYTFVGARDPMAVDHLVLGMRSSRMIILWVRSADFTWYNAAENKLRPRPPSLLVLEDVSPGTYAIQWWDTREGRVLGQATATTTDETLAVEVPALTRDIAAKIIREGRGR